MSLLCMLVDIQEVLSYLIVPLFLGVGIFLTIKTGFLQLRAFPKFLRLLRRKEGKVVKGAKTINPLHAFFVSLSTTIGTGNIMGPSVAIVTGGPGALFWMVAYAFFAGVIKFAEVSFAIHTRTKTEDGRIIGGPTQYLKLVHRWLANWYGYLMIGVLAVWSGVQTNNIANILAKEGIPVWQTGLFVAIFVFIILGGGAKRVGMFASKLVPIMGFSYLAFASFILLKNLDSLKFALSLVFSSAFSPAAAVGGFLGASVFRAMSVGFSKSAFSSEAGLGTSSITHAVANVKKPTDQGILALYGVAIDAIVAFVSGLLILMSGMWMVGEAALDSTLVYEAFQANLPVLAKFIFIACIGLFALTSIIGNSFNGSQNFAAITRYRWVRLYQFFTVIVVFFSALMSMPIIWRIVDILIIFIALPNIIGITILVLKHPKVLKVE